jgi:hypothetical protein
VQLNFRMLGCDALPLVTIGAPDLIAVSYRVGDGTVSSEELPLGAAKLNLRMPSRRRLPAATEEHHRRRKALCDRVGLDDANEQRRQLHTELCARKRLRT